MYDGERAQSCIVMETNVTGQGRTIGHGYTRSDHAVVGNVYISHDPVTVSDHCLATTLLGAPVKRAVLTDGISVADF